jgi:flagellin
MIGGLGSSLSTALRTAGEARSRMDRASREIATGQRVASAKDDGAAWTRAAGLRSDQIEWRSRAETLDLVRTDMEVTHAVVLQQRELWSQLDQLVLQARGLPAGSQSRQTLQAEWNQLVAAMDRTGQTTPVFQTATFQFAALNSGIGLAPGDSFLSGGGNWLVHPDLDLTDFAGSAMPVAVAGFDLVGATSAQLDDVAATIRAVRGDTPGGGTFLHLRLTEGGRDMRRAESLAQTARQMDQRMEAAIGALTDADLGKASTARAQSETRQQLALQTVRQALDAYGAFAGGLLGNVQRTQRGISA